VLVPVVPHPRMACPRATTPDRDTAGLARRRGAADAAHAAAPTSLKRPPCALGGGVPVRRGRASPRPYGDEEPPGAGYWRDGRSGQVSVWVCAPLARVQLAAVMGRWLGVRLGFGGVVGTRAPFGEVAGLRFVPLSGWPGGLVLGRNRRGSGALKGWDLGWSEPRALSGRVTPWLARIRVLSGEILGCVANLFCHATVVRLHGPWSKRDTYEVTCESCRATARMKWNWLCKSV
jgi:hypothetical protein